LEGEEEQVANAKPGEPNFVIFSGIVETQIPAGGNISYVDVHLNLTLNHDWPAEVSPSIFRMGLGDHKNFEVTVWIPEGTLSNVTGSILISGNATGHPVNIPLTLYNAWGLIRVAQYHDADINIVDSNKIIEKDDKCIFNLEITNKGNGNDVILFNIDNNNNLVKNGIEVYLPEKIELDVNETKSIEVIVKTSSDTKKGEYDIHLNLTSELDCSFSVYSLEEFKLSIQVQQNYTPYFVVGFAIAIGIIAVVFFKKKSKKV
jgi:uncharacterized membrane protein